MVFSQDSQPCNEETRGLVRIPPRKVHQELNLVQEFSNPFRWHRCRPFCRSTPPERSQVKLSSTLSWRTHGKQGLDGLGGFPLARNLSLASIQNWSFNPGMSMSRLDSVNQARTQNASANWLSLALEFQEAPTLQAMFKMPRPRHVPLWKWNIDRSHDLWCIIWKACLPKGDFTPKLSNIFLHVGHQIHQNCPKNTMRKRSDLSRFCGLIIPWLIRVTICDYHFPMFPMMWPCCWHVPRPTLCQVGLRDPFHH